MLNSYQILEDFRDSLLPRLEADLPNRHFLIELSNQNEVDLSDRQIPDMRIGIYQRNAVSQNRVEVSRMLDFRQQYEISVFIRMPQNRVNDFDELVEKPLIQTFDSILNWLNTTDFSRLTSSQVMYTSFISSSATIRNNNYCFYTIQFSAFRIFN